MELEPLFVRFEADISGLNKKIEQAQAKLERFNSTYGASLDTAAQKMRTFGYLSLATLTLPLVGAGKAVTKLAHEYEASMQMIVGLVGEAQNQVNEWSKEVLQLAPKVGKGPKELADALYFITSAGVRGAEAMDILTQSAKAASAGLGETKNIADLVVSVLAAYKGEGLKAADVTDVLVAAVKEGKAEASAFANVLGSVLPLASEIGMSFDEVSAAVAAMTITGSSAAQATTYLRGVLNGLYKENEKGRAALSAMGSSYKELRSILGEQGMIPLLQKIRELQEDYGETLASKVFPNIRALTMILDMAGKNFEYNIGLQKRVTDSTGALTHGFDTAAQTMKLKYSAAQAEMQVGMIQIGEVVSKWLLPIYESLSGMLVRIGNRWKEASEAGQLFRKWTLLTLAALGPLAMGISTLIYLFTTFRRAIIWVQIAMLTLIRTIKVQYLKTILAAQIITKTFTKGMAAMKAGLAAANLSFASVLVPIALVAAAVAGLVALFKKLRKAKKEANEEAFSVPDMLKDIENEGNRYFAENTAKAKVLVGILTEDGNQSLEVRKELLKQLNDLMKDSIGESLTLESTTEDITAAYEKFLGVSEEVAAIKIAEEQAIALTEKMREEEQAVRELKKQQTSLLAQQELFKKYEFYSLGTENQNPYKNVDKDIRRVNKELAVHESALISLQEAWANLSEDAKAIIEMYTEDLKKLQGGGKAEGHLRKLRNSLIGIEESIEIEVKIEGKEEDYYKKIADLRKQAQEIQDEIDQITGKSTKKSSTKDQRLQLLLKELETEKTLREASVERTIMDEELKTDALFKIELENAEAIIRVKKQEKEAAEEIALLQAQQELRIAKEVSRKKKAEAEKQLANRKAMISLERSEAERYAEETIYDRDDLARALENIAIDEEQRLIWLAEENGKYDLNRQAALDERRRKNSKEHYDKMYALAREHIERMSTMEGQMEDLDKQYARAEINYAEYSSRKRDIAIAFYDFEKHSEIANMEFRKSLSLRQLRNYQSMLWEKYEATKDVLEQERILEEIYAVEAEERYIRRKERMKSTAEAAEMALTQFAQNAIVAVGEGVGNLLTETESIEDVFNRLLGLVADFLIDLGKAIIATAVLTEAFKKAIATNPEVAIAAGVAAIALGTYIKNKLSEGPFEGSSASVPSYAEGAYVPKPTLALIGDAKDGRGEWVFNFKQVKALLEEGIIPSFANGIQVGGKRNILTENKSYFSDLKRFIPKLSDLEIAASPEGIMNGTYNGFKRETGSIRLFEGLFHMMQQDRDHTLTAVVSGKDLKFVLDQEYKFLGRT